MTCLSCSSRYPNISCELLTSDVSQMNDRLGGDESLLVRLYSFLLRDSPLNPLLASFFSKVLSILISRKPEQVTRTRTSQEQGRLFTTRCPADTEGL